MFFIGLRPEITLTAAAGAVRMRPESCAAQRTGEKTGEKTFGNLKKVVDKASELWYYKSRS